MTQPPQSSGPLSPQNGPYSQGGMPAQGAPFGQGSSRAPAKKPSKAPKILFILGGVILVLSVVIGAVIAYVGLSGAVSTVEELEVFESGSGTVTAEAGDSLQVYAEQGAPTPSCTIDGPAVGEGTSQNSTAGTNEDVWVTVDSFTAEQAGEYEITCDQGPIAVGPPISVGGIFAGLGGIFLAIGGGGLGVLLLLIGVVVLFMRKRSAA